MIAYPNHLNNIPLSRKKCRAEYNKGWFARHPGYDIGRKAQYRATHKVERRAYGAKQYQRLAELKPATGCTDCGFAGHPAALEYDHLPGRPKHDIVAHLKGGSWDKVLAEIENCELVCANCHRIGHVNR